MEFVEFNKLLKGMNNGTIFFEFIVSSISLFLFITIYNFIKYGISKQQEWKNEKKRLYLVRIRNLFFLLYFLFLIFLWGGELKVLFLSAAALVAAFFITFKEVWLSIFGYFTSNKSFPLNDFIDYDGVIGKIIDKTFFHTKIAISSQHNSKIFIFPNMLYLTSKITNISKLGKYHSFSFSISNTDLNTLYKNSEYALNIANKILEEKNPNYEEYFKNKKENDLIFDIPNYAPILSYDLSDSKKLFFTIHYIAHPSDKYEIERKIKVEYLKYLNSIN